MPKSRFARNLVPFALALAASPAAAAQASIELADAHPATIQAALDDPAKCPTTGSQIGCHLVLPCDRQVVSSGADLPIEIDGLTNVRISGCGMNGTTISWDPSTVTSSGNPFIVEIDEGSRWVTIEDLKLELSCTSECTSFLGAARVLDGQDVTFERVHFHAASPGSSLQPFPAGLTLNGAQTANVYGSRFHATGFGLSAYDCEDCWFSGNWFGGILDDIGQSPARPVYALASKRKGTGVRFTNNTFDMSGDVSTGLYLSTAGPSTQTESGGQVIGNSFINMGADTTQDVQFGIAVYFYNRANIQNNLFACALGEDSCDPIGVEFIRSPDNECVVSTDICNQQNTVANNVFDRIIDNDSNRCPVRFLSDTELNRNNFVRHNVFRLGAGSATGANGCCHLNESLNDCADNEEIEP